MHDIAFGVTSYSCVEPVQVFPVEDKVTATCLLALMIEPKRTVWDLIWVLYSGSAAGSVLDLSEGC
jgi:hypothetical protein